MKFLVDFLVGLPTTPLVGDYLIPWIVERNIIDSESILANLHTIVYVILFYHAVYLFGSWILFPPLAELKVSYDERNAKDEKTRSHLIKKHKGKVNQLAIQSSIHLISFLQTLVVLYLSFAFFSNREVSNAEAYPDSDSRIFGEVRETQLVCLFGVSYFIWDMFISAVHSTFAFFIHGVVSTGAYYIGMKPYLQYYAPVFLMMELSNPSLNIRWFLMKYFPKEHKISKFVLFVNNLILMIIFFFVRICWGWYSTIMLIADFYNVRNDPRFRFVDTIIVVTCNLTIDCLNIVWFSMMVSTAVVLIRGDKKNKKKVPLQDAKKNK